MWFYEEGWEDVDKSTLRFEYLEKRKSFIQMDKHSSDLLIARRALEFFREKIPKIWGLYFPLKDEVNISSYLEEKEPLAVWTYPAVCHGKISFYYSKSKEDFQKSNIGVMEPIPERCDAVDISQIQGCFIPGIVFDKRGYRIGRGRGHYDRFLKSFNGQKVGIAYSIQIHRGNIAIEDHDVPVDNVITEKRTLSFNERN